MLLKTHRPFLVAFKDLDKNNEACYSSQGESDHAHGRESGSTGNNAQSDESTYKDPSGNRNDRTNLEYGLFNIRILIVPL